MTSLPSRRFREAQLLIGGALVMLVAMVVVEMVGMLAVARLYLDNFPHVQASWFSEGKRAGQVALSWGADDFGGTLFEENVHAAADFVNKTSVDEIVTLIRDAGFTPAQRTTDYEIVKTY